MKKIIGVLAIYTTLAFVPAYANVGAQQTPAPAQGQCTDENKAAWYADFTKFRIPDPPKAYEAAKKYLGACPQEEGPIPTYLKKWSAQYDKDARKSRFQPLLYGDKKYAEAFALGKEILADEPENLRVIIDLGYAGFYLAAPATKNESFNADSLTYARKAIQMIESGKTPESLDSKSAPWSPFKGKDDTLAYLYNAVGRLTLKDEPSQALTSLIKAAHFESDLKKDPWIYFFIAAAYENGPYAKLSAEYDAKYKGKDETQESKLALENVNQVVDRIIDAYARAVALAGNDPKFQQPKQQWLARLTDLYKFRHNQSDAGLNEMIASVMSKPLPPEPTPITTLPAAPTTTTPASGSVSTGGSTSTTTAVPAATPAASSLTTTPNTTTTTTTTTKPATKSPAKPPAKPKPRNNHRRH